MAGSPKMVVMADDSGRRLTLSALTLGELPFEERVAVAADAGFGGIGLRAEDYVAAIRSGLDDARIEAIARLRHLAITEVELLAGWGSALQSPEQRQKEETIFHMARRFRVDHVNAALFEKLPLDLAAERFAALCRRAGDVRVALEFMPFGGLPDIQAAWTVVRDAGEPNAGLLVDAWHWARAGTTPEDLAEVPADRILAVQLSDVGERPQQNLRQEALHHRLAPGQGYGDVAGMLAALRSAGVDRMMSVEVMSDELLARGPRATAEAVMAGARAVL